jgi:hypothetical protein
MCKTDLYSIYFPKHVKFLSFNDLLYFCFDCYILLRFTERNIKMLNYLACLYILNRTDFRYLFNKLWLKRNYLRMWTQTSQQGLYIRITSIFQAMHNCFVRWNNSEQKVWFEFHETTAMFHIPVNLYSFTNKDCILIAIQFYLFQILQLTI